MSCRQCGGRKPSDQMVTCGKSECQEAEAKANTLRNKKGKRK